MDAISLGIKNKVFNLPTKLVDIYDFNPEKLEINPAGKYWYPGRPEDVSHQRPQDVP